MTAILFLKGATHLSASFAAIDETKVRCTWPLQAIYRTAGLMNNAMACQKWYDLRI
jgi:hypothetical protein